MDIYGTIGPACAEGEMLTEMFRLGMTGIRLNLSHAQLTDCGAWTELIQESAFLAGVCPKFLIDLQGPELRVGALATAVELREGSMVRLEASDASKQEKERAVFEADVMGEKQRDTVLRIPVPDILYRALRPGQEILLDDGKILLQAVSRERENVCCQVRRGGLLTARKSVALSGIELETPTLTESDRANIREAKKHGVTGVMLPFVRRASDLQNLKRELLAAESPDLEVFAKIESLQGVRHLESLLPFADHIVIARGDLGNRMPLWELPAVQAKVAAVCRKAGAPYMVVTQMLASMENCEVPTRAEVSDIFRAVSEGASSVMVTGETAAGKYPVAAMEYLCRTVKSAQEYLSTLSFCNEED